jgi:CRAL/TRIO domain
MKTAAYDIIPPKEAYRYWPSPEKCLIETEEFVERLVFAKQDFKEWEKVVLEQLEKYLIQHNLKINDRLMKLRFLYGQGWNIPQTYEALKYDLNWKQEWPSCKSMMPLLNEILSSGGAYIHGRDHYYRPAIILRPSILAKFSYQLHLSCAYFLMEFILETMLIPGQIENWVVLVDLKNFRAADVFNHRKLIAELFTHYPCRLGKMFLLRCGKNVSGLNKILPQNTLYKVQIVESDSEMLTHFNPQQLEARYGGSANNLKSFWPPFVPSSSFRGAHDPAKNFLSTHSSYKEYFPANPKIYSDISSLKASQAGEKESFISNNDFKDEVWQRLELVSASYSFLTMEHLKSQENEEKKDDKKQPIKTKTQSEDATKTSSREPNPCIKDEIDPLFMCNLCSSDCIIN